tara:strand:- start:2140 stop:2799 length:660 start_codon:yes stop_codon:yes gene_type:complete
MKPAFTRVNKYIFDSKAWSWSLPSGWSCPGAKECLAKADRATGKVTAGPEAEFKCYSATYERFPSVRERLWTNFEAVKGETPLGVVEQLEKAKPKNMTMCRIHTAGDFFSWNYFHGWMKFITDNPHIHFWAFTKSLALWVNWIEKYESFPPNLEMNASHGGKLDHLIAVHGMKSARVVYSRQEAHDLGLKIDTDDRLAAYPGPSFALLENFTKQKRDGQ